MSPMLDYTSDRSSDRSITPPRNTFTIAPAAVQDARRLVDIEFHAFENEQTNHILSYRDHNNPRHFSRTLQIYTSTIESIHASHHTRQKSRRSKPTTTYPASPVDAGKAHTQLLKVVDEQSGEVVSFTKIETKRYSPAELLHCPPDVGHEDEPAMNRDWFALNEQTRRAYMGTREHCYVGMLATQPQHQHRGAGTLLLATVLAQADRAGVEVYLEGTDTARPLYEKHGFRGLKELRFDPAEYGVRGFGVERQMVMVRGALGPDGVRREVRGFEEVAEEVAQSLRGV